ncbi:AraC family transcriptional regulator [Marinobacter salarius]|uniref:AraC family transcriptional regulator n=1 Tax=Marinobacter salarius TaxID=1420917 RepID=UPI00273B20C6|nr:AraC family transcriptional regulator [Marinobacter salarius]MDP4533525.1 AraC family transcriptional regulator [Marinobacter salarius]
MLDGNFYDSMAVQVASPEMISAGVKRHIGMHEIRTTQKSSIKSAYQYGALYSIKLGIINYGVPAIIENNKGLTDYQLHLVTRGTCDIETSYSGSRLKEGHAIIIDPLTPSSIRYHADCSKLIIRVPKALLDHCVLSFSDAVTKCNVSFSSESINLGLNQEALDVLNLVCRSAVTNGNFASKKRNISNIPLSNYFATKLLEFFENNTHRIVSELSDNKIIEAVQDYISRNINDNISITELASQLNMSKSKLFGEFSREKGISPAAYIKQKKLIAIHERLSNPNKDSTSVSQIALDFGFNHLGRFSSDYKKLFNELPSETVRKSRHWQDKTFLKE